MGNVDPSVRTQQQSWFAWPGANHRGALALAFALAALLVVLAAAVALWHLRQEADRQVAVTTQNLAWSLEQTIDGMINTIDFALQASADEIEKELAAGKADRQTITRFLTRQQQRIPYLDLMRATDEKGDAIYGAGVPFPPANNSDRDYFARLRTEPNAGLVIAKPIIGRISHQWIWLMARRISKPDGSFGGVVYASIIIDMLEKMFAQFDLEPNSVIVLRDNELGLIARNAFQTANPLSIGDKRLSLPFQEALKRNPLAGTYVSDASNADGVSRTYSYRRSARYGYTILVGIDADAVLREWRKQAAVVVALVAAFVATALALMRLLVAARRRRDDYLVTLEASRESLREAQQIANLGHYAYELQRDRWTSSDTVDAIFGIDGDYPHDREHWLALIAADVRAQMAEYFACLISTRQSFDREYRIVRVNDGAERWVHGKGILQADAQGNLKTLIGTIQDITERKQVELALQRSEMLFRQMTETLDQVFFKAAADYSHFDFISAAADRIWGRPRALLFENPAAWLDWLHPDDRADVIRFVTTNRNSDSYSSEFRLVRPDGVVRWIRAHAFKLSQEQGADMVIGYQSDITERKLIEQELSDSVKRFNLFMDNSPAIAWIKDAQSRHVYFNKPFQQAFNPRGEDWYGKTDSELWPGGMAETFRDNDRRVMESGTTLEFDERSVAPDGTERIWQNAKFSFLDAAGRRYVAGIGKEVTAARQMEAALNTAQERLSLAQRASGAGVWDWYVDSETVYWSSELAELFGLDPSINVVPYATWQKVVHPDDLEAAEIRGANALRDHAPLVNEYRIILSGGQERWIVAYGNAIYDERGHPVRMTGICVDISARKLEMLKRVEAEQNWQTALQEVEKKERSKSRFLAATAHDLRQPLYAAQLFIDSLASTPLSSPQLTAARNAKEALRAMSEQLQLLLEMSRMDDTDFVVKPLKVSTIEFFERLADVYGKIAARSNVRLLFRPGDFTLVTDMNLLSRLVGNLIDNAIKFSPGGTVLVCARASRSACVLHVRDNGIGMADIHHGAIFDDFYQIGNIERDPDAGYGLGLAIVHRIARLLGVRVAVASRPGKGSVFSVVMPR